MGVSTKFKLAVFSACIGSSFQYGFHTSALSLILFTVVVPWYKDILIDQNEKTTPTIIQNLQQTIMACFAIGGILGALLIGFFSNVLGRKLGLIISNAIVLLGLAIIEFSLIIPSYELFIIGRIIMGISAGLGSGLTPIYLVEISPTEIRGAIGSIYYFVASCSMLFPYIFGLPQVLGQTYLWGYIFLIGSIPAILQIVLMFFAPESPIFLYVSKEDEEGAEDSLAVLRTDDDIENELADFHEEVVLVNELDYSCKKLCSEQTIRSPLIISCIIMFGQQMSGISVVFYYSYFWTSNLELKPQNYTTAAMLILCNVIVAFSVMFLMERIGRKVLLLISFGGMSFVMLFLLIGESLKGNKNATEYLPSFTITLIFFYVLFFAMGAGPIPWFYIPEICNYQARPWITTISFSINWITCFLIVFCFILLEGYGTFINYLIFFVSDIFVLVFLSLTMRETMNELMVDIFGMFQD